MSKIGLGRYVLAEVCSLFVASSYDATGKWVG